MIVLTVKTLDSQNHTFTVDDDITVEEFKAKIADTVNIPAETQRIIYCGRVLQDDVKLSDYDVNGKVVHLVERPPPGANPPTTRSSSPQSSRRNTTGGNGGGGGGFRGFESAGNTVYLGSMAFPSNLMESQGIVPPPPTHSLAGSRLNVARRMLRRAEAVITLLENPTARPCDIVNPDEQQDEEVTPIIEARVIVPPGNNEHIDEAMVISAVQNSLFDSGALPVGSQVTVDSNTNATADGTTGSSTPEETANTNETTQNDRGASANNSRPLAENASRTSEMADLITMLNQLQTRFAPFLERYHQFMAEDPVVPSENVRQTQVMLSRVSEVLHFLGHAYHSLSDIIIRVRTSPPRPLLCRPILIQHSAVVQTGIPIQVEVAQFNLSTDRSNTTSTTTSTNNTTTTTTTAGVSTTTPSTTSTTSNGSTSSTLPNAQQQPFVNVRGFPLIPAASMRVQSFPIELRTTARPIGVNISQRNNSGSTENTTTTTSSIPITTTTTTVTANSGTSTTATTTTTTSEGGFQLPNFNNSSVEFFMEVTPEGTLNGPPPEFLQSLVQMAGQIMNRVTTTTTTAAATTTTATSSTASASTVSGDSSQTPGQNSQARGNTQTHPTTSTHTRSTSRPHVHLAQQAMQGGFDPFLPCNSHHITHRRRQHAQQQQQQPQQQVFNLRDGLQAIRNLMSNTGNTSGTRTTTNTTTTTTTDEQRRSSESENNRQDGNVPNVQNPMGEIYSALRTAFSQRRQNDPRRGVGDNINASIGQASNENRENTTQNRASFVGIPPNLQNLFTSLPNMLQGPTIAEILQQLPPDDSAIRPGESMITDLIMLLSRSLTLLDMITLNSGNFEPLNRVSNDIQQFFMTRVLDGSTSQEAVNRGVDRFINEMQPFFENFSRLRVRDEIDIVRSVEQLFRRRLPDIITTAANVNSGNMRDLVNHCLNLAKLTCSLTLNASVNGLQGVEETFQQIITSYMQGIPAELQNWTLMTSCANLRHFMGNLGTPDVESYIIRNSEMRSELETQQNETRSETVPQVPPPTVTTTTTTVEPMELDMEVEISEPEASAEEELEDPEPLPNVVIGSEPWHNQVPEDWVPIITRDVQRQRRQNPQTPFSDAYLSGMPTKRRKIVNSSKPQGSLPQVISESVRRAITTTGLASVAPLEVVSQAAGNCADVQTAYRSLLRTTVQTALRDNEDFTPERFPNAATYFKTP